MSDFCETEACSRLTKRAVTNFLCKEVTHEACVSVVTAIQISEKSFWQSLMDLRLILPLVGIFEIHVRSHKKS